MFAFLVVQETSPRISGVCTMQFESNHFRKFSMSASKHFATSPMFSPEAYNILPSAKLHIVYFSIHNIRSFINILNNKGPRIEPCGIPDEIKCRSL